MGQNVDSNVNIKVTGDVSDITSKIELFLTQLHAAMQTIEGGLQKPAEVTEELISDLDNLINHISNNASSLEGVIPTEQFNNAIGLVADLREQYNQLTDAAKKSADQTAELGNTNKNLDSSIGENGGVMSELLKNSSFNVANQTQEEIDMLAQEEAQRQALVDSINREYSAWYQNEQAKQASIESSQLLVQQYNSLQGAIDSLSVTQGSLGSNTSGLTDNTQNISAGTEKIASNISNITDKTKEESTISDDICSSVTGIITGLNQGLELVEKIAGFVTDISEIAEEINQTLFEMSTVLGSEVTDGIVDYTNAMQELYGLDGTTMLNQLGDISSAVSKMGLSSSDALAVTKNLGNFAQDLGAITGDFDKAYNDLGSAIEKGFVGRGSALYNILSKDEINKLKSLDTEIERFNYLMSKSDRINGTYEKFLETSNGKIYLLNQSFESLKSNVAAFANAAYAAVAPVLTNIIQGLNSILSKLMTIFNIGYEAPEGMSGIASSFTDSAEEIKNAADSAKKSVLSFDDVITLDKDTSNKGSGLGDVLGNDTIDTGKISSAIEQTRTKLDELVEHFKSGWSQAWDAGNGSEAFNDIQRNMDSIKTSLAGIWTDPEVQSAMKGLSDQWSETAGAIVGAAQVTGLNIAAGLSGGTAKWLETDSEHIKDKIVDLTNASTELGGQVEQAAINFADFSTIFNSEGFMDLTASMEGLGFDVQAESTIIGTKAATAIVSGFNSTWDVSGEDIKSACTTTFSELSGLIDGIDVSIQVMGDIAEDIFDNYISPAAERLGSVIGEYIINPICEGWENDIAPVLGDLGDKISELWTEHIQPLYEKLKPLLDMIGSVLSVLIELIGGLASIIISTLAPVIGTVLKTAFELVINIVEDICDLLGGLIDLIVGMATGDKDKIVEGFKEIGKSIGNALIDILNGAVNLIIGIINGLIGGVNKIASFVGITDPVEKLPLNPIPRLATGGIVTSSTFANIGEDGAEAVVPLERNKGWMRTMAKEIASQMNNNNSTENKSSLNVTIDMSKCTKEYYTKSEMIAMGELFGKCLKQAGMNVAVV